MKHPANRTLFDHWQSLRRGRQVPDRNDLDPVAIRGVLSHTFMLEVDAGRPGGRAYPIRVSGTRLDALLGHSAKGTSFTGLWQPRHRAAVEIAAEAALDEGRPAVIGGSVAPAGYPPVAAEALLLPLRCQGRTHARLFCSLVPLAAPTWLGLDPVEPLELTAWRLIDPGLEPSLPAAVLQPSPPLAVREAPRRQFTVIAGGRSLDDTESRCSLQARIKAVVAGSANAPLSSRSP